MKSTILIISGVFPPEPIVSATLSYDIAEKLSETHEVTVLCRYPSRPVGKIYTEHDLGTSEKYKIVRLKSYLCPQSKITGRFRENIDFGKKASQFIKQHKDTIHCIYANVGPLFAQSYIVKAAKNFNIPCVIHVQDVYPESLKTKLSPCIYKIAYILLFSFDKYVLRNCTKILAISNNMKHLLSESRRIPEEKIEVVCNWQNEEEFVKFATENEVYFSKEAFTFMYLGNNGPVAGVDFLIKCFVNANIPNSRLIIAGGGSQTEYCKNLAETLKAGNIIFRAVPNGKVPEVQSIADVMLLPVKKGSAMSSIPSKLPAYMFSEKPIIGSLDPESDTAKAIVDSNSGILVEPENEKALQEAMKQFVSWDRKQLKELGRNGFVYAMKHFSKKENLQNVVDLILKLKKNAV